VGALFDLSGGSLGGHYCSASVVDSSAGDVLITAAHCAASGTLAFVPDYHSGEMPYGVWPIAQVVTDAQWRSAHDPDDDVAFLIVHRHGSSTPIEKVTGAERLGIGQPTGQVARVIGYPSHADSPVICQNRVSAESSTQMRFDCANYPAGTSGGPFLVDVDPLTGKGMVIGVIGGYEQGGYTPSVSYSPAFGQRVEALFQTAVSEG
jgi:V8-like Glu-specific endopeptidase